jgi:hypothetical protein
LLLCGAFLLGDLGQCSLHAVYLANLIDERKVSSKVSHQQLGSLLAYPGSGTARQKEGELEGLRQGSHPDGLAASAREFASG